MLQHETLITNNLFDLLSLKYELTLFRLFMKLLIKLHSCSFLELTSTKLVVTGANQYFSTMIMI